MKQLIKARWVLFVALVVALALVGCEGVTETAANSICPGIMGCLLIVGTIAWKVGR